MIVQYSVTGGGHSGVVEQGGSLCPRLTAAADAKPRDKKKATTKVLCIFDLTM